MCRHPEIPDIGYLNGFVYSTWTHAEVEMQNKIILVSIFHTDTPKNDFICPH